MHHNQVAKWTFATAAFLMVAASCNNKGNEGKASINGQLQGSSFSANSALYVATGSGTAVSAGAPLINSFAALDGNTAGNANTVGDGNTVGNANSVAAGNQAIYISISTQAGVCNDANNGTLVGNSNYLVFGISAAQLQPGTYNLAKGSSSVTAASLLPGALNPNSLVGSSNGAATAALDANTVGNANTVVGNGNSVVADGNATTGSAAGSAFAYYVTSDASCSPNDVAVTGGQVTLSQVDLALGTVAGSFNVSFSGGDSLQGSFTADACPSLSSAQKLQCQ